MSWTKEYTMTRSTKNLFYSCLFLLLLPSCKAEISEDCTVNGFGSGTCSFTNRGDGSGTLCGTVEIIRGNPSDLKGDDRLVTSSVFCSGKVEPSSTTKVEFSVPGVSQLCDPGSSGQSWNEICYLRWQIDPASLR